MLRATPLVDGETYHIYNRGAGKQSVFTASADYERFLLLLYFSNNHEPVDFRKYKGPSSAGVFREKSSDSALVDLLAYALIPNHFHLVLRQRGDWGITRFMRKLATGYSMYFNTKYEHSGVLFQGRFKSSHLDTDSYFKWIFPYVHLNPVSIVERDWQEKGISEPVRAKEFLRNYRYSSYYDYYVGERPERAILAYDEAVDLLDKEADLQGMLSEYGRGRVLYSNA
jgi:putative transposase